MPNTKHYLFFITDSKEQITKRWVSDINMKEAFASLAIRLCNEDADFTKIQFIEEK